MSRYSSLFTPGQVAIRDFGWMCECDVFVPVLDDGLLGTDGMHVELGWAGALGRPIVGITDQPFAESAGHLLEGLDQVAAARFIDPDEFASDPSSLVRHIVAALGSHPKPLAATAAP